MCCSFPPFSLPTINWLWLFPSWLSLIPADFSSTILLFLNESKCHWFTLWEGNTSFHYIFSSIWNGTASLKFLDMIHYEMERNKKSPVSALLVKPVSLHTVAEMLWAFVRSFLIFEFPASVFFCSVIQNSHWTGIIYTPYSKDSKHDSEDFPSEANFWKGRHMKHYRHLCS